MSTEYISKQRNQSIRQVQTNKVMIHYWHSYEKSKMATKMATKFKILIISGYQQHINIIPNANHTFTLIGDVMVRTIISLFMKKFKMVARMHVTMGCQYRYPHNVFWRQQWNKNSKANYIFSLGINLIYSIGSSKMWNEENNCFIIVISMKNPRFCGNQMAILWQPIWQPNSKVYNFRLPTT